MQILTAHDPVLWLRGRRGGAGEETKTLSLHSGGLQLLPALYYTGVMKSPGKKQW